MRFQDTFARCTALNSLAALEDLAAIRTKQNKNVVNAAMFQLCHPVPSTFFPPNHRINSTPMLDTARYSGGRADCCSIPSCCACPACCSSCLTRNKASHFVCLQREPTFSRRWALGVMLPRYLYDAVLWPLSAEIAMQKRQLPRDIGLSAANAPAHTLPEAAGWLPLILPSGAPPSSAGSR